MAQDFDRMLGALHGLPDVVSTAPRTLRVVTPLVGNAETFILQTIRQREIGDHVFLEHVSSDGTKRIVIPPEVSNAIAAQREALTARARVRAARQAAATRKERGIEPAFVIARRARGGK